MLELERHRFTLAEYDRVAAAGVIDECERVELIDGDFLVMSPIGDPHAGTVDWLARVLVLGLGESAIIHVQNPIAIDEHNVPHPDVAILRPRADFHRTGKPTAADILLLIEVSDMSVRYDRSVKMPMYSRAGISEAWLVDVQHGELLVHTEPRPDGYGSVRTMRPGDSATPIAFPELALDVAALLG
jgi:Uma2 family endonuclease